MWTTLWPPISLATVGAILERDGHDVKALDGAALGYPRDQLVVDIESEPPDAVIWSTGTPSIASDLSLADEIREIAPGAHCGLRYAREHTRYVLSRANARPRRDLSQRARSDGVGMGRPPRRRIVVERSDRAQLSKRRPPRADRGSTVCRRSRHAS